MPDVTLTINGAVYDGWENVRIHRTLEAAAGGFSLEVSGRERWPIAPGAAAVVKIDGDTVITGYVDVVDISLEKAAHTITVQGRDKTADLVDCAALNEPGEWTNSSLATIAAAIARPFGVTVTATAGEAFPVFKLQPGEKAWEAIERACRMRGLLAITDGIGALVLIRPNGARGSTALVEGENVVAARANYSLADRFSQYVVKGQSAGGDDIFGEAAAAVQGKATDGGVKRYRPYIVLAETGASISQAEERARWEATVRAARGSKATVTVVGWRQGDAGPLWNVNRLVSCALPTLGIAGDMLISGVQFAQSLEGGTVAVLDLVRPDAFLPEPVIEKAAPGDSIFGDIFE